MKNKTPFWIICIFMCGNSCLADTTKVELGWTNLPECSKASCSGTGLFCPDTVESTPQRIIAYLNLDAPSVNQIIDEAKRCAGIAAAAAGLSSILTSPATAQPAFYASFSTCMANYNWSSLSLSTETKCEGW